MPNYKKHLAGAVFFYAIILFILIKCFIPDQQNLTANYISILTMIQWLIFTLAGALYPDIDINSKGRNIFYKVFLCLLPVCFIFKTYDIAMFVAILFSLSMLVKHRGLFHNFWFNLGIIFIICSFLLHVLPDYRYYIISNSAFFSLGILSHLWLDLGIKKMLSLRW